WNGGAYVSLRTQNHAAQAAVVPVRAHYDEIEIRPREQCGQYVFGGIWICVGNDLLLLGARRNRYIRAGSLLNRVENLGQRRLLCVHRQLTLLEVDLQI